MEDFLQFNPGSYYYPIIAAIAVGTLTFCVLKLLMKVRGIIKMRRRKKFSKEVIEVLEDQFVEGMSRAIDEGKITIEEARQLYAKIAHFGFWGLHPRKFTPRKTPEQLAELKQQIKERLAAKTNGNATPVVAKLLDGVVSELN